MSKAKSLEEYFISLGATDMSEPSALPDQYSYVVTNGDNILAVGSGVKHRIRPFFYGNSGGMVHTKTFIVCASHALNGPNRILVKAETSRTVAAESESALVAAGFPKVFMAARPDLSDNYEVSAYLWNLLKVKHKLPVSSSLDRVMELVFDNGDVLKSIFRRLKEEGKELNSIVGSFFNLAGTDAGAVDATAIPFAAVGKIGFHKSQFLIASEYLASENGKKAGTTRTFYFESSDVQFVLEVEKPSNGNPIGEIIGKFGKSEYLEITDLVPTGRADGKQFYTGWGNGTYIVFKVRCYANRGPQYFDKPTKHLRTA